MVHMHLTNIGGIWAERSTHRPARAALTAQPGSPAAAPSRSLHLMPGCHLEPPGSRVLPNHTSHWSCCLPRSPPLPAWQWGRPRTCPDSSLLPWSLDYSSLSLGYTSKSLTTWLSPSRKSSRTRLGEARGPSTTHFLPPPPGSEACSRDLRCQ